MLSNHCKKKVIKSVPVMWVPQLTTTMIYNGNSRLYYSQESRLTVYILIVISNRLLMYIDYVHKYIRICHKDIFHDPALILPTSMSPIDSP